jgi:hypothetical protein
MKPCIYGQTSHPEGTVICVDGRGLLCVLGEWRETDQPCAEPDGTVRLSPEANQSKTSAPDAPVTKAKR